MKKPFLVVSILLAGLLAVGGFACAEEEEEEGAPSGWEICRNDEHGFRLYYPED